ncbi:hypothetical protein AB0D10_30845 [Kitasatospora sp. NPDC048545]|uniref:hypothetical protein n=1 Tax=Kitasatospora sp. NPDC048545 TaxID=3157208 RepID=UPI00340C4B7E
MTSPQTLLHQLVERDGLTFAEFADDYQRTANLLFQETGDPIYRGAAVSEMSFQRWKKGDTSMPRRPAPKILKRMFGRAAKELFGPCSDEQASALPARPMPDESELRMTARDARAHATEAAAQILPDLSIDQLEDDLARLVRAHTNTPPHDIYLQVKEVLELAKVMLDRTQRLSQRGRLYLAAGEASALLGGCAFDLGLPSISVELLRAAALYGELAEHDALQAYSYGYLAILAYWNGNPTQAVRHVTTAQQFADVGDAGKARLAAIAARAHAHLGRVGETQRAIRLSLEDRGRRRDAIHDDLAGEFAFSQERVAMSNSSSYLLLRDGAGAENSARQSLQLIAESTTNTVPFVVAPQASSDLAMALLLGRDLDGAAEALAPVLAIPRQWRGAGLVERLDAVRGELVSPTFRDSVAATSLAEQIEEFTAVAAPRLLGPGVARLAIGSGDVS